MKVIAINASPRKKGNTAILLQTVLDEISTNDVKTEMIHIGGDMMIVGSSYWNQGVGKEKGDVLNDEEGLRTMKKLAENMAWLLSLKQGIDGSPAHPAKKHKKEKVKKKKS